MHEGVDIFAPEGEPVYAIEGGMAYATEGENQGVGVSLVTSDGSRYTYAHLSDREGEFPRKVEPGELLGYVGTTGNAVGTVPHLHFEWRPGGGSPADPAPMLDAINSITINLDEVVIESDSDELPQRKRGGGLVPLAVVLVGTLALLRKRS